MYLLTPATEGLATTVDLQLLISGTTAVTMQLIDGKLTEIDREPQNVQIIIKGMDENDPLFFN